MLRTGTRGNEVRVSLHYMPNCTRVIVPPMAGLEGACGWRELYLAFLPVDDVTNRWFVTNLVGVSGEAKEAYLAKRDAYSVDGKRRVRPRIWHARSWRGGSGFRTSITR